MAKIWNKHKQTNTPIKRKVFVGMSGGVDSSVSAALLKIAGYDVTGVFIKVWQPDFLFACGSSDDRLDAKRVCAILKIPFRELDLEKEYKKEVVDYMITEYKSGRTPNPDVMCNRFVKFGGFFNWTLEQGADFVATGHYAQIVNNKLKISKDNEKDQTYFLWTLKEEQLSKILFPIGNMTKPEVRKMAKRIGLPNAEKKDSQGLCFLGKIDIKDFLSHYIQNKKGNVLDERGKIIGEHNGAFFFTIGERHGFTIKDKTPNDKPYFVIRKDVKENTITVAHKNNDGSLINAKNIIELKDMNCNQGFFPINKKLSARSRYREDLQEIKFIKENVIEFKKAQNTISSGQSLVIYDGDICLGGGIIY